MKLKNFGLGFNHQFSIMERRVWLLLKVQGEEVYGSHSRTTVARVVNLNSMDTDEEIVKPSNMEIQNFSKEGLTTIPLIVPLIYEKIPDLVEATHSLDNSRFSSTSSKA